MKTTKIRSILAGVLAATLITAIPVTGAFAAHRDDAEQAIAAAKVAHEKAVAAGKADPGTEDLIKQAERLLPTRQYTKAIEMANLAIKQDEFAATQADAGGAADAGDQAAAEKDIADADAARKKAAAVGGEWKDTGNMIKEATDLVKSGEYAKAIKLANEAKRQGELGYAQAMAEKDADFPSYVNVKQ